MSSDNKIYSINPKKKEIVIEKAENDEISELIKNINKLSKKYDFFNREFSCDNNNFKDEIKDIIENVINVSKSIDREIIQKGNIKSEKNMFVEYI